MAARGGGAGAGGLRLAAGDAGRARRLSDYTHLRVEASVVLLTLASFAVLGYFHPRLAEVLPTHWRGAVEPNGWARGPLASVFFAPALGLYLQVFFFVLKRDLVQVKMTLPAAHAEEYLRGKERLLAANMHTVDLARASTAALVFALSLLLACAALPEWRRYEPAALPAFLSSAGVPLAGMGYFIRRMVAINGETREAAGGGYVQRDADEGCWRHSGLTYYNPDDPAFLVEKLVGLGYTFNMAHPALRRYLVLPLGVLLFVMWAVGLSL